MTAIIRDFGMYTTDGNYEVSAIADYAKQFGMTWDWALSELEALANQQEYSEAMDTVVREAVYTFVGFKTPFYV